VAVIGAGIAGITAGVLLPRKVPGIQLTIFDKNNDVVCIIYPSAHASYQHILTFPIGRHMARKHLSRRQMRHPITLLPVNILAQGQLVRGVRSRTGDQGLLAVNRQKVRRPLQMPLPDESQLSTMESREGQVDLERLGHREIEHR
jgi:hypothetical protein